MFWCVFTAESQFFMIDGSKYADREWSFVKNNNKERIQLYDGLADTLSFGKIREFKYQRGESLLKPVSSLIDIIITNDVKAYCFALELEQLTDTKKIRVHFHSESAILLTDKLRKESCKLVGFFRFPVTAAIPSPRERTCLIMAPKAQANRISKLCEKIFKPTKNACIFTTSSIRTIMFTDYPVYVVLQYQNMRSGVDTSLFIYHNYYMVYNNEVDKATTQAAMERYPFLRSFIDTYILN